MAHSKRIRKGSSQHPARFWPRLLKPKAKQIGEVNLLSSACVQAQVNLLSACVHTRAHTPLQQDSGLLLQKSTDFASAMEARKHLTSF